MCVCMYVCVCVCVCTQDLSPSPNFIIGVACLSAMQRLAARLSPGTEGTGEAREGVRQTLLSYAQKVRAA